MLVLKDVLRPCLKPGSSGGKSSNQTSTLQTATYFIQVKHVYLMLSIYQRLRSSCRHYSQNNFEISNGSVFCDANQRKRYFGNFSSGSFL